MFMFLLMFMISTITIFIALIISKILSLTVLKNYETAPFLMEMPAYHLPSFTNVFRRVVERTWMFLKKVLTIIIFVMIVLYFLLNFPGLGKAKLEANNQRAETIVSAFIGEIEANHPYALSLNTPEKIADYFGYDNAFSASKRGISDERKTWTINREFLMKD